MSTSAPAYNDTNLKYLSWLMKNAAAWRDFIGDAETARALRNEAQEIRQGAR